jgi:hypothetical protein
MQNQISQSFSQKLVLKRELLPQYSCYSLTIRSAMKFCVGCGGGFPDFSSQKEKQERFWQVKPNRNVTWTGTPPTILMLQPRWIHHLISHEIPHNLWQRLFWILFSKAAATKLMSKNLNLKSSSLNMINRHVPMTGCSDFWVSWLLHQADFKQVNNATFSPLFMPGVGTGAPTGVNSWT